MKMLFEYLKQTDFYKKVQTQLNAFDRLELNDTFETLNVVLIQMVQAMTKKPVVVVHHNLYHAQKLYDLMHKENALTAFFPQDEFITTDMLAMSEDLKMERLHTIEQIIKNKTNILITHPTGFVKQMLPKSQYEKAQKAYRVGEDLDLHSFQQDLVQFGYKRVTTVENTGEFSQRGSIFDVFLTGHLDPIRIDLFDTEIDTIRYFDVQTQRSKEKIETFEVFPRSEFFYTENQYQSLEKNVLNKIEEVTMQDTVKSRILEELAKLLCSLTRRSS